MTAFPWLKSGADARPLATMLAESGVLVVPGYCFGMPEHFRFGFTAVGDRLEEGLREFERLALPVNAVSGRAGGVVDWSNNAAVCD